MCVRLNELWNYDDDDYSRPVHYLIIRRLLSKSDQSVGFNRNSIVLTLNRFTRHAAPRGHLAKPMMDVLNMVT